ncbi:hypothetical protein [Sphingobacterium kyonggiense]
MKHPTLYRSQIIYLISLFCMFISCDKIKDALGDDQDARGLELFFERDEYMQGEIIEVSYEGSFSKDRMKVNIAGKEVDLIHHNNKFLMMVPLDQSGEITIQGKELTRTYRIQVRSSGPAEPDPDKYVENILANQAAQMVSLKEGLDSLVVFGVLTQAQANQQSTVYTDSLAKKKTDFAKLSADQKQIAVKFLKANYQNIKEVDDLIMKQLRPAIMRIGQLARKEKSAYSYQTSCQQTDFFQKTNCIIYNELIPLTWKISSGILLSYAAVEFSSLSGWGVIPGLAVAGSLFYFKIIPATIQLKSSLWEIGSTTMIYVGEVSDEILANSNLLHAGIKGLKAEGPVGGQSASEFHHYIKKKFNFKLKARNLQPQLDQEKYGELFQAFSKFQSVWNLPFASKIFGNKPSWPIERSKTINPPDIKYLTLYIDNAKVQGKITGTNNNMEIHFYSKELGDQNFNYKINYNDGFSTITSKDKPAKLLFLNPDYQLEVYHRLLEVVPYNYSVYNFTRGSLITTLKPGDAFSYYLGQQLFVRLKYKGQYVQIAKEGDHTFGFYNNSDTIRFREKDYYLNNAVMVLEDLTNGHPIVFPMNLNISNAAYRMVAGKKLVSTMPSGGKTTYTLLGNGKIQGGGPEYTWSLSYSPSSQIKQDCQVGYDPRLNFGGITSGEVIGSILLSYTNGSPCCVPRNPVEIFKDGRIAEIRNCTLKLSLQ